MLAWWPESVGRVTGKEGRNEEGWHRSTMIDGLRRGGGEQGRRVADLGAFYSLLYLGCEHVYPDEATQQPSSGFPRCLGKVAKQDCGNLYQGED